MDIKRQEQAYFDATIALIQRQLKEEMERHDKAAEELREERRYMWEETNHTSSDLEKLGEMLNSLSLIDSKTASYEETVKTLKRYRMLLSSPYFARLDYQEDGMDPEAVYIGRANLMDQKTLDAVVYDWRSPIASVFYRFSPGKVWYDAPYGKIEGELRGKRQFSIKNGVLEFFFDSDLNIQDEMLGEALAKNASVKMKTIVETIQAQQDEIIRDDKTDVLVVQGVAGSGKTSVALHRVAYLMYQGMTERLKANHIVILSPNDLFSTYISGVLPELGEENVTSLLFEDLCVKALDETIDPQPKNRLLDALIASDGQPRGELLRQSVEFKGSRVFMEILDRLIDEFVRRLCPFKDLYYNGACIATRQEQKEFMLHNVYHTPVAIRLRRLEDRLIDQMREMRQDRAKKLAHMAASENGLDGETKALVRSYAVREANILVEQIRSYTRVNYLALYRRLFADRKLFFRLAAGLPLPEHIGDILTATVRSFDERKLPYEDSAALCYLTTKMAGIDEFRDIRQVVVDEAQDYDPLHFAVLKNVFPNARFTILGDVNQAIEKTATLSLYDEACDILGRKTNRLLTLSKSYRSTVEIQGFASKLLSCGMETQSFERHGEAPKLTLCKSEQELDDVVCKEAAEMLAAGLDSVAILCKTASDAKAVHRRLSAQTNCTLIDERTESQVTGLLVVPIYMAKGLEFDGAIVYDASADRYRTPFDRQLLYVASTRPLHRLMLTAVEQWSRFLS